MSDLSHPTASIDRRFLGHPIGLATLFFTEMWERFGYYGMRALLILYLTAAVTDGGLGMDAAEAGAIYALFTSMGYLLGLPGGWFADRVIGQRRAVLLGGTLLAAGYLVLAVPSTTVFFIGLGVITLGTGLLKPNISAIVGQLYTPDDERRDAGFSIFYMGINVGALLGPVVCAWLGERVDWHYGFAAAGVGMVLGLAQYVLAGRWLGRAGLEPARPETPEEEAAGRRQLVLGIVLGTVGAVVVAGLFGAGIVRMEAASISNAFGVFLLAVVVAFFGWLFLTGDWTSLERGRLWTIVILFLAASFFWGAYEQAGSTLNLFAERSTDRSAPIVGEFPAGWFQTLPALFVILQAPLFAWLWVRLGRRQPSSPAKFALGLTFVGLGFVVMMGASAAAGSARVSPMWLVATYFLHVVGEMCLSPVGLSTVTKLAPARVTGLMMGAWFLASAVGNYLGGRVAGQYESLDLGTLFGGVAAVTIVAGAVLALLAPSIRRLMGGVH